MKLELLPVVVFSFSKKLCEELTYALGGLDLNDNKEKGQVYQFVDRSVSRLQVVDRRLPQVRRVRELAARGIGVHHAGMLPLLKEVVEMLFGRGLIKVLFATETFAMGVNMPTRTVVFNGRRKHDGTQFRDLLPSEYTQMAGRAGRRGLDSFGVVILFCRNDEIPAETDTRHLLTGKATRLESRFRLTFNMLLNLLRQEDLKAQEFIKRSFHEAPAARAAPAQRQALVQSEEMLKKIEKPKCEGAGVYLTLREKAHALLTREVAAIMKSQSLSAKALGVGRVLLVRLPLLVPESRDGDPCPAVVLQGPQSAFNSSAAFRGGGGGSGKGSRASITALVLLPERKGGADKKKQQTTLMADGGVLRAGEYDGRGWAVTPVRPEHVDRMTRQRLRIDAEEVVTGGRRANEAAGRVAAELLGAMEKAMRGKKKAPGGGFMPGWAALHPQKDLKIKDLTFLETVRDRVEIEEDLRQTPCFSCACAPGDRARNLQQAREAGQLSARIGRLRNALSDGRIGLLGELEQRVKVLQALDHVGQDKTVLLKGRVACEINTCECLIVTELIFENVLDDLDGPEAVALLSALVFQRRTDVEPKLNGALTNALEKLRNIALAVANIQVKHGMDVDPQQFVRDQVHDGLMQVTYEWARGTPFHQICELTDIPEGSIVRCILRLNETLKDVRNAARVIGDPQLYQTMERCSELVKRDIVFAASLYVA